MEEGKRVRIERQTSIETEPMTLRFDQIHDAREAALYVIKTRTMEEAMHIFTQGMEEERGGRGVEEEGEEEEEQEGGGYMEEDDGEDEMLFIPQHYLHLPLQAFRDMFRDVTSAPF